VLKKKFKCSLIIISATLSDKNNIHNGYGAKYIQNFIKKIYRAFLQIGI